MTRAYTAKLRVLIVADSVWQRYALSRVVGQVREMEVVGTTGPEHFAELVRLHRPDVVLTAGDGSQPGWKVAPLRPLPALASANSPALPAA